MKRKVLAAAVAAICLSAMTYGTLAYFTAEDTAHNVITTGDIDIEIQEWADEDKTIPFSNEKVGTVMPGKEVTKIAEVKNTGSNDAYIRAKVDKIITLSEDAEVSKDFMPDGNLIRINFGDGWTEKTIDGETYFYYNSILPVGEVTAPLFYSVTFDGPGMGNEYQNCMVDISITAEATQAANQNVTNSWDALGWPGK